ncbi:MAG: hypothetical protein A2107_10565 [Verrucomicrobia bacterium GWF2_62_7]|nr:MAG: hypothetical protein A2107_10565 [Verrucomicrobia bacterium GWF2_62_7]
MSLESKVRGLVFCAIALAATGAGVRGQEAKVSGKIEVKGQKTALTHVCAIAGTDSLEAGDKEIVAVLLSTQPVPPEMRKPGSDIAMWAGEEARAGRLDGIILMIDPKTNIWSRGQRLSRSHGLMFYSYTSTSPESGVLRFEPAPSGPAELAGKVWMREPMRGMDEDDGPWRLEAEFRTPVIQQEAVTAKLTGAAALNSPQFKAAMAFNQACQRKDLEAVKRSMDATSQAMLAQMIEQMGRDQTLTMLAAMGEATLKFKTAEVTVRGLKAEVKLMNNTGSEKNETVMTVALDNGVWKMSR